MKNIIEVKDLIKKYKKAEDPAVKGITFNVKKGEFFAFLGPNGAGKTTTISILTTLLSKTSGDVKQAGYDLEKDPLKIRNSIGVIFQNPSLDENLTAEENVRFHAILYGLYQFRPSYSMMDKRYKDRIMHLAEVLGIQDEILKPVKTFSGGMKRKLEIIRSLMHNPKILYLDEPTSGLDPASRKSLWQYLSEVRDSEKTTIFLTTHYLEEAEDADRVAIISKGKIVSLGTPKKIKEDLIDEYLLIDAKNRDELKQELKRLKINFEEDKHIRIDTNGLSFQEVITKISTPLTLLKTHSPTLEEAYLAIINKNGNN